MFILFIVIQMFSAFNTMGSTLAIPKKNNTNTSLNVFTINGYSVSDGMTLYLPYDSNNYVTVVATSSNPNASVVVSGDTGLTIGNNTITVTVSINSYTSTYTVIVNMYNYIQSLSYTTGTANISYSVDGYKLYRLTQCLTSGNLVTKSAYSSWSALGSGVMNNIVEAVAFDNSNKILYVGGSFTTVGGVSANQIAKYSPSTNTWSALGSGVSLNVLALEFDSTNQILYVGGNFITANGNITVNRIAKYNVSSGNWSALGSGVSATVSALVFDSTNQILYVGGTFTTANGNITVNRIAKYTVSTNTWSALGSGVSASVNALEFDSTNQILYVGGNFITANGNITVNRIAKYNVSSGNWSALGSGVSGIVYALALDSSQDLYVGGQFTTVNGNITANQIAKYSPSTNTWSALGSGLGGTNAYVSDIVFDSSQTLYVGGSFTDAGGISANGIVKYTVSTNTWSTLVSGLDGTPPNVYSLAFDSSQNLYVGGTFNTAGGISANNIAKYNNNNNNSSYDNTDISYIMVGGGGGGGGGRLNNASAVGGGGGGGGQVSYSIGNVTNGTYSVTIGNGGNGGNGGGTVTAANGTVGGNTVFNGIISTGGKFGRGGGTTTNIAGGAGYTLNGNIYGNGGNGNGASVGGNGTNGYSFSFPNVRLGAGGGGGSRSNNNSIGGNFGGGNGSGNASSLAGTAGTAYYGAGGGGGGASTNITITYATGLSGGSGTLYMWSTIGYLSLSKFTVNGTSVSNGSTVSLAGGTSNVTVVATPTDLSSNVTITGNTNLQTGNNTLYANVSKIVAGNTYTVSNAVTLYVQ